MYEIAKILDMLTGGFIRANHITAISLAGHILLLLAIIEGKFDAAAIFLIGFGLMDALDGAVAKYQGRESAKGELIDSVADRIKEALLYGGLVYYFAEQLNPTAALLALFTLGLSFAVTFVKARGEVSFLTENTDSKAAKEINRKYGVGLFGYEVRMAVMVVGFIFKQPEYALYVILIGCAVTFIQRFVAVIKSLK